MLFPGCHRLFPEPAAQLCSRTFHSVSTVHLTKRVQTIGAVCDAGHHVDKSIPVCFKVGVSLGNSGCPGTHPVERAGLQLKEPFRLCLPSAGMTGLCRSARQQFYSLFWPSSLESHASPSFSFEHVSLPSPPPACVKWGLIETASLALR